MIAGGVGSGNFGFVVASPNEEAKLVREASEQARLERLRQVMKPPETSVFFVPSNC